MIPEDILVGILATFILVIIIMLARDRGRISENSKSIERLDIEKQKVQTDLVIAKREKNIHLGRVKQLEDFLVTNRRELKILEEKCDALIELSKNGNSEMANHEKYVIGLTDEAKFSLFRKVVQHTTKIVRLYEYKTYLDEQIKRYSDPNIIYTPNKGGKNRNNQTNNSQENTNNIL